MIRSAPSAEPAPEQGGRGLCMRERVPALFASARLQQLAALAWTVEAPLRRVRRLLRRAHEQWCGRRAAE